MKLFLPLFLCFVVAVPALADTEPTPDPVSTQKVELFKCVRVQDVRNIHPCAVPKIVSIANPCYDPCDACSERCVNVQICVPPCGCPDVKVSRRGTRVKYDYGKYAVKITSRRGVVTVNYDD